METNNTGLAEQIFRYPHEFTGKYQTKKLLQRYRQGEGQLHLVISIAQLSSRFSVRLINIAAQISSNQISLSDAGIFLK